MCVGRNGSQYVFLVGQCGDTHKFFVDERLALKIQVCKYNVSRNLWKELLARGVGDFPFLYYATFVSRGTFGALQIADIGRFNADE